MKCGSYVLYVTARKKGSGTPYERVKETLSWWATSDLGIRRNPNDSGARTTEQLLASGYVICDGDIKASVKAVDEPDWGCTYARLEVSYKCEKCGQTFFPGLPDTPEGVSEVVTRAIASASSAEERLIRNRHWDDYETAHGKIR